MNTANLQVPLSKDLKDRATQAAKEEGFSSLQEFVRVLLTKVAKRELALRIENAPVRLSAKNEKRYAKMDEDFAIGKDVYYADGADDLISQLHGDTLPKKLPKKLQKKNSSTRESGQSVSESA